MSKLNKSSKSCKPSSSIELKVVAIGNTRLTWEETYKEAAREREDWSALDVTLMDGLDPKEKL